MATKNFSKIALLAIALTLGCSNANAEKTDVFSLGSQISKDFMRGFDASTVDFLEENGAAYFDEQGQKQDIFKILKDHGVSPYSIKVG